MIEVSDTNDQGTVLDRLIQAINDAATYNSDNEVAPAVILWTDEKREWQALPARLRGEMDHFLTLGNYNPEHMTGPAIWLRCMVEGELPEADWDADVVPVVYLPGVSRKQLREVEDCPEELHPLLDLQFRGEFFSQSSGRDWTIRAFMGSDRGGLGLDVATDQETLDAMELALLKIMETPVERLQGRRLEAEDFNELLVSDPERAVLTWLCDPEDIPRQWDDEKWDAFKNICRERYEFDPDADGELAAAEKLGIRDGQWDRVWTRFSEAPERYEAVAGQMEKVQGGSLAFEDSAVWPQKNASQEEELRTALESCEGCSEEDVRGRISDLEKVHGRRRDSVWARQGKAPLAQALGALVDLSEATQTRPGGTRVEELASAYAQDGWKADWAVLKALQSVKSVQDKEAVVEAIRVLYRPWMEELNTTFQNLCEKNEVPSPSAVPADDGPCCYLFVDGLRFDVARELKERLQNDELDANLNFGWAATPSVTATAKYAVSPVRDRMDGRGPVDDFAPDIKDGGQAVNEKRFCALLEEEGYQVLPKDETGDPSGNAWTQHGSLDKHGHNEGWKLAHRVDEELDALQRRVVALLKAGWQELRILTDHGWLLMPGGLPKAQLHSCLAHTKWGRCATLKSGNSSDFMQYPWFWEPTISVVTAPGIHCFRANQEYAHGGLSLQECLVPRISIQAAEDRFSRASIDEVKWIGLRCRVQVEDALGGYEVDIRTNANRPESSITQPKTVGDNGKVSLVVEDDELIGTAAHVVLLDHDGRVVDKRNTEVEGR